MFSEAFEKSADLRADERPDPWRRSRHTRELTIQAQPKRYKIKYHPSKRRWSCNCQDWMRRRQWVANSAPAKDKNCKHIKAHLRRKTAGQVRREEVESGYRLPPDLWMITE